MRERSRNTSARELQRGQRPTGLPPSPALDSSYNVDLKAATTTQAWVSFANENAGTTLLGTADGGRNWGLLTGLPS